MKLGKAPFLLLVLLFGFLGMGAKADIIAFNILACFDPNSVNAAITAYVQGDVREIARLDCLIETPSGLRVRVLRCEATGMKKEHRDFGYPVISDTGLPRDVCELDVLWGIRQWRGTIYTKIWSLRRRY